MDERNSTTIRLNLFHKYKVQVQVKKEVHAKNMNEVKDNFDVYNFCKLLHTKKWDEFIKNLLNDNAKHDFLDEMAKRLKYYLLDLTEEKKKVKINKYPPYAIQWEGMTSDVSDCKGGVRKVDLRFYNGYLMLPSIVTVLHAKTKNEIPLKIVGDATN